MYGWRARIGLIMPSPSVTGQQEFLKVLPDGVALCSTRVLVRENSPEAYDYAGTLVERAAEELAMANVKCIMMLGTAIGFYRGFGTDKETAARVERVAKVPSMLQITATVNALKLMNLKRLAVATPYPDWINTALKKFLEDSGFEVLSLEGLKLVAELSMQAQPPTTAYQLGMQVYKAAPQADGILLACSTWPTLDIIEALEADTGKPVVSSGAAAIHAAFTMANLHHRVRGYGSLLEKL